MGRQYLTLETAVVAAPDTEVELVDLGGDTPSRIVEAGKTRIKRVIAFVSADGAALGAAAIWIRIYGSGIDQAEVNLAVGAHGGELVTGAPQSSAMVELKDLDIKVKPGSAIRVGGQKNADIGDVAIIVTLELE